MLNRNSSKLVICVESLLFQPRDGMLNRFSSNLMIDVESKLFQPLAARRLHRQRFAFFQQGVSHCCVFQFAGQKLADHVLSFKLLSFTLVTFTLGHSSRILTSITATALGGECGSAGQKRFRMSCLNRYQ
jgi:hypothetical protein